MFSLLCFLTQHEYPTTEEWIHGVWNVSFICSLWFVNSLCQEAETSDTDASREERGEQQVSIIACRCLYLNFLNNIVWNIANSRPDKTAFLSTVHEAQAWKGEWQNLAAEHQ